MYVRAALAIRSSHKAFEWGRITDADSCVPVSAFVKTAVGIRIPFRRDQCAGR
ncbi:TPA: hypothetical protein N0F65_012366 [Lagenidium giganteum]|uniref:Uncharacterized protein n=1 Tax=Lagenidium giganteum TaxID=4803 RepID=A0AAV2YR18_9STRA|nr:TPA: hypothetical protein N0F65_012366 [Lagenidium giganteum]